MFDAVFRYALGRYKTVDDIPSSKLQRFNPPLQQARRKQVKIAVIDDQPFEAGMNLRNFGYNITEIGDIKNISEVSDFPIVLCDLMDVGIHFDQERQGSSIIREIRRNYPAILVAAYSGSPRTSELAQRAIQVADGFINKDAEMETWVSELDKLISKATDPRELWMRTRKALSDEQINTRTLIELEDSYVRSINKNDYGFRGLKETATARAIGQSAQGIISGLIASTIFKIIVG